ncbi:ParB N-terminal domain-containing protein [Nocardia rhizosphaerae]|uniref:ParB N-terminal domain-containing protein n=1 Tax=Nocardia rhizosphaerae TaxID=1691571 RepID=A0ABV8LE97_9NOCA
MQTVAERTEYLVETVTGVNPVHEVQDHAKLAILTESMREHGWQGPPLVIDGDQAITGAHRFAAAENLRGDGIDIRFPVVQVAALADEYGIGWPEIRAEHTEYDSYIELIDRLPADVVDYFGLDLH